MSQSLLKNSQVCCWEMSQHLARNTGLGCLITSKNLAKIQFYCNKDICQILNQLLKLSSFVLLKQEVNDGPVMEVVLSHQTAISPRYHTTTLPLMIRKSALVGVL